MTGIDFYDLPSAPHPTTEALRVEDLQLLARFPGDRVVFADMETADSGLVNAGLTTEARFAHIGGLLWANCPRKERDHAAAITGEVLGREVTVEDIAALPADCPVLVFDPGARVIDLWAGLAEAAQSCGARRPVFTGLAAACLLAEEVMEAVPMTAEEENAVSRMEAWRAAVRVRSGCTVVFVITPGDAHWPGRAESLCGADSRLVGLGPAGCAASVEEQCPGLFASIIEGAGAQDENGLLRWYLTQSGQTAPHIILPARAAVFPGAALYPYKQFDGCDFIMEMDVPSGRRDLGPADGKPSRTGPVFLSAELIRLLKAKPLPARVGWRYAAWSAARQAGLKILLRHAGASGWHDPDAMQ